jgi:hypothetical protein
LVVFCEKRPEEAGIDAIKVDADDTCITACIADSKPIEVEHILPEALVMSTRTSCILSKLLQSPQSVNVSSANSSTGLGL